MIEHHEVEEAHARFAELGAARVAALLSCGGLPERWEGLGRAWLLGADVESGIAHMPVEDMREAVETALHDHGKDESVRTVCRIALQWVRAVAAVNELHKAGRLQ
jgi:hypothetical protein